MTPFCNLSSTAIFRIFSTTFKADKFLASMRLTWCQCKQELDICAVQMTAMIINAAFRSYHWANRPKCCFFLLLLIFSSMSIGFFCYYNFIITLPICLASIFFLQSVNKSQPFIGFIFGHHILKSREKPKRISYVFLWFPLLCPSVLCMFYNSYLFYQL